MTLMAWMAASVVFLLQLAALATQQQPARGSIEGVVERAGTGEPIAGAEIRVMRVAMPVEEDRVGPRMAVVFTGSDPFAPVPAITDREGHFLLKDLEPGSYKITAARNGYAKQEYGRRIPLVLDHTGPLLPQGRFAVETGQLYRTQRQRSGAEALSSNVVSGHGRSRESIGHCR